MKLQLQFENLRRQISELDKPYYVGKGSMKLRCSDCGTELSTVDCGKTYFNNCPICDEDLRPIAILDKLKDYKYKSMLLQREMRNLWEKHKVELIDKPVLYWFVSYSDKRRNENEVAIAAVD